MIRLTVFCGEACGRIGAVLPFKKTPPPAAPAAADGEDNKTEEKKGAGLSDALF